MELSQRLLKIAKMINEKSVADIGCDHGYLPIYLVKNNIVDFAIGCDINRGPLNKAKINIEKNLLSDKIETRLGDGLSKILPNEVSSIVISGMGGILIKDILRNGIEVVKTVNQLVLQPQRNISSVRKYIQTIGFKINDEAMVYEDEKYYTIISAIKGEDIPYSPYELLFGRILIENKDKILKKYLIERNYNLSRILETISNESENNNEDRINEIKYEKMLIREVMECL